MMTANLHCNGNKMVTQAEWVRRHNSIGAGERQDYFAVRVGTDGAEVTLFLAPEQLVTLVEKLSSAVVDRGVVLVEESKAYAPLKPAGGV